jgi:hypothetical protein
VALIQIEHSYNTASAVSTITTQAATLAAALAATSLSTERFVFESLELYVRSDPGVRSHEFPTAVNTDPFKKVESE